MFLMYISLCYCSSQITAKFNGKKWLISYKLCWVLRWFLLLVSLELTQVVGGQLRWGWRMGKMDSLLPGLSWCGWNDLNWTTWFLHFRHLCTKGEAPKHKHKASVHTGNMQSQITPPSILLVKHLSLCLDSTRGEKQTPNVSTRFGNTAKNLVIFNLPVHMYASTYL